MKAVAGQFSVQSDWRENAAICGELMTRAAQSHADLLVLPEAVLARSDSDPGFAVNAAQPPDGPFITQLCTGSRHLCLTTVLTIHTPDDRGGAFNTLLVLRSGAVIASYRKLHLYDAFNFQESLRVTAGTLLPPVIEVAGMHVGVMTCYDLRFPEMALSLALRGARVIAVPAAWVRGPHKEQHWTTLLAARALDTTCYLVAAGECGGKNIGQSRIVSPLGVTLGAAESEPALVYADLTAQQVQRARDLLPILKDRRFAPPRLI